MLWAKTKAKEIVTWPLNEKMLRAELSSMTLPAKTEDLEAAPKIEGPDGFVYLPVQPAAPPLPSAPLMKHGLGPPAWQKDGTLVRTFVEESRTEAEVAARWAATRIERKKRLAASDWTQMPDVQLSETDSAAVLHYRQQLRDITSQADPFYIAWPALVVKAAVAE